MTMSRMSTACLAAVVLLNVCASSAQAWRLFPTFSTGYWDETAPLCPSFNASTEPNPFHRLSHPKHNTSAAEPGKEKHQGEHHDKEHEHPEPPEPRPHPPGPHPKPPHPPHPPRPFPGPPFYHGQAGPRFHVANRTCGYETRLYNESTWVLTNSTGWSWEFAVHNGFLELDPYFHGENANNSHFPPSIPVVSRFVTHKNFSDTGKEFLVARYVPKKCHKNSTWTAPTPNNDHIKLKTSPDHYKTYVRTFPGLGLHWAVLGEMRTLRHDLERDGVDVKDGQFFAAQYNPFTEILHRHNEVWFIPTPEKKTEADTMGLNTMWTEGGWGLDADLDESS